MSERKDDFYVGYAEKSPASITGRTRIAIFAVFAIGLAAALLLVSGQARFDRGTFEFGIDRTFEGILVERPYPELFVREDGGWARHLLVRPGKFGAAAVAEGLDGRRVRITGSRIFNDRVRMIEVHDVTALDGGSDLPQGARSLGRMTLRGEIVDSKCHLGVMKPGRGKPHKACATRCIAGGIPPVLRVEDDSGAVDYWLLVSPDGGPVGERILDWIAEPVEITGEVFREEDRWILRADPADYRSPAVR